MNKKTFLSAISLAALTFYSCGNEDFLPQDSSSIEEVTDESKEVNELSKVASLLTQIPIDTDICKEVHNAVSEALDYGVEESYYFQEILTEENEKITTRSNGQSLLGSLIKEHFQDFSTRSTNAIDLDALSKSDIQIYWPYSEDWDGETLPVITYAPEDQDQEWNYAYKVNGDKIDTIIVDEDYMQKNPVWIVNKSDISYEALPDFSKNQTVKNNVAFLPSSKDETGIMKSQCATRAIGDPVYTVYVGKFMADKQYDGVFAGGSEFVIQMGQAQNYSITSENLTSLDMRVNVITVSRSRKDIKNKRWKDVSCVLVSDWLPEENNAAFMIHEDDGGGTKRWDAELSVTVDGSNYGAKVSIPYGGKDDIIYRMVYTRNFMFSTNNSEGTIHNVDGVHFTLPYKIGRVVEW